MPRYDLIQLREIFHLLFLERLLKISDPALYVLKGGVNLRFFFSSPRYSEDMDLDALGGGVETLKKNGYRILDDPGFRRSLASYGISDLEISDPDKAKHTETTQRFRVRLISDNQQPLPTKVEFSRRVTEDQYALETIEPEVAKRYRRLSFQCHHYTAATAVRQKILALANRAEVQARDVFDLYILWLGGHANRTMASNLPAEARERAAEQLLSLEYHHYQDQVLAYIAADQADDFAGDARWNEMSAQVLELLAVGS